MDQDNFFNSHDTNDILIFESLNNTSYLDKGGRALRKTSIIMDKIPTDKIPADKIPTNAWSWKPLPLNPDDLRYF